MRSPLRWARRASMKPKLQKAIPSAFGYLIASGFLRSPSYLPEMAGGRIESGHGCGLESNQSLAGEELITKLLPEAVLDRSTG